MLNIMVNRLIHLSWNRFIKCSLLSFYKLIPDILQYKMLKTYPENILTSKDKMNIQQYHISFL